MKKIILIICISIISLSNALAQEPDKKEELTKENISKIVKDVLQDENLLGNHTRQLNTIGSEINSLNTSITELNQTIKPEKKVISLHLNDIPKNIEETIENGKYSLHITSNYACEDYLVSIKFTTENHADEPLSTTLIETPNSKNNPLTSENNCTYSYQKDFDIENGTTAKLIVIVKEKKALNAEKNEKEKIVQKIKIKYKSIKKWKWITTLGVAAVSIVNSDTYKTEVMNNEFIIKENGSQKLFQSIPIMQFSYINSSDNFIGVAPSGGIGFDLDNLSVFGGVSFYFGKNVFLTMGAAFHQQLRLDSKYDVDQIVSEEISEDDLNSSYYRVNPFVSLTFRLDKNIFKK